jgi:hypothetical protein
MHQAPTAAMMLRHYGITSWNKPFKDSLLKWHDSFGDPACIEKIKMQWIKRVVTRTHKLLETEGLDINMLVG